MLQEFKHLIGTNPRGYMLIGSMLQQALEKIPYDKDPTGSPQVRDYRQLLQVLDVLMTTARSWNDPSHSLDLAGLPLS